MKKLISITFVCVLLLACKKHTFDETLPKLVIQSVTPYVGDSVLITANFTGIGIGKIDYVGFCSSGNPNPDITSNQVLGNGTTSAFTSVVYAPQDSIYYLKAFAANEFGYTASNVFKYVPSNSPSIAPCSLSNNRFSDNGTSYNVFALYNNSNNTVNIFGNENIVITFASTPHNGIYTTTANSSLGAGQVNVDITSSNQYTYPANNGGLLYVAIDSIGTTTVSTCSIQYNTGTSNRTVLGKVSY